MVNIVSFQTLNDEFRVNYANLWLSLMKTDLEGIKHWSRALGAGDLYGLFACMVTARSWESVTTGIQKKPVTEAEVSFFLQTPTKICENLLIFVKKSVEVLSWRGRRSFVDKKTMIVSKFFII